MKTVSILVPETAVLAAVVDPRYMFTAVNEFEKPGQACAVLCSTRWPHA